MSHEPTVDRLAEILRAVAEAEPPPWRAGEHAARTGTNRDELDDPLNVLRVGGFIRLTDWEKGKGQGYVITQEGRRALNDPRRLEPRHIETAPPLSDSAPKPVDEVAITRLLIAVQAAVFAMGLFQALEVGTALNVYFSNGASTVQNELSVSRGTVLAGEWWRLWGHALVHVGFLHLAVNLYGTWIEASLAEQVWGRWRFAAIYLIAVLGSGVMVVLTTSTAAAGSSGGLCGVIAAQMVWIAGRWNTSGEFERMRWSRHYVRTAIYIVVISLMPGVSWSGHLGGAIGGAIAAGLMLLTYSRIVALRRAAWAIAAVLPIVVVFAVSKVLSHIPIADLKDWPWH